VSLTARLPGSEVARLRGVDVQPWEVRLLVFGVIGTAIGAFQWSASPWFVRAKLTVAEWLVEREAFVLLDSDIPWWLLTHYPEASDVFTWLDGLMILGYIGAAALLIGGWISLWLRVAGFALGEARAHLCLAYALIPLGGIGVFLGLSALTVTLLAGEGVIIPALPLWRGGLLALGTAASLVLAALQLRRAPPSTARRGAAFAAFAVATAGAVLPWVTLFYLW
jgi:hypothetical protein